MSSMGGDLLLEPGYCLSQVLYAFFNHFHCPGVGESQMGIAPKWLTRDAGDFGFFEKEIRQRERSLEGLSLKASAQ